MAGVGFGDDRLSSSRSAGFARFLERSYCCCSFVIVDLDEQGSGKWCLKPGVSLCGLTIR